jgi:tyrosine-protein kinase Etk/Wzc
MDKTPNKPQQITTVPSGTDFMNFLTIVWNSRKFVVVNFLVITILAAIISFILPKWYKATASILPPKDQGLLNIFNGAGSTSILKGLSSLSKISSLGQTSGPYNYFAILKSRTAMEQVVNRFNLISVYDVSENSMEKAIKELQDNVNFDVTEDDYFTIEVLDKDPVRAAAIANYFVEILNTMSIELATREARSNREFIEKRLEQARDSLAVSEETLKRFQEKSGLMISAEQTSGVSALAELYAEKTKKEIEVAIAQKTVTADNPSLRQLQVELAEFDKKLGQFPQAGLESYRLLRDVLTQQKIIEFLAPLYEQAKINEQKDVPVLLVLDKAIPPEKKFKPKRTIIVATAAGLSVLSSVLILLGRIYLDTIRRNQNGRPGTQSAVKST